MITSPLPDPNMVCSAVTRGSMTSLTPVSSLTAKALGVLKASPIPRFVGGCFVTLARPLARQVVKRYSLMVGLLDGTASKRAPLLHLGQIMTTVRVFCETKAELDKTTLEKARLQQKSQEIHPLDLALKDTHEFSVLLNAGYIKDAITVSFWSGSVAATSHFIQEMVLPALKSQSISTSKEWGRKQFKEVASAFVEGARNCFSAYYEWAIPVLGACMMVKLAHSYRLHQRLKSEG